MQAETQSLSKYAEFLHLQPKCVFLCTRVPGCTSTHSPRAQTHDRRQRLPMCAHAACPVLWFRPVWKDEHQPINNSIPPHHPPSTSHSFCHTHTHTRKEVKARQGWAGMRSQGGGNVRGCEGGLALLQPGLPVYLQAQQPPGFSCFHLTLKHAKNSICKFLRPRKSEHTATSGCWQLWRYFLVGKSTIPLPFSFTWPQQKTCWWRASWTLFRAINLHWLNSADGICPRPNAKG